MLATGLLLAGCPGGGQKQVDHPDIPGGPDASVVALEDIPTHVETTNVDPTSIRMISSDTGVVDEISSLASRRAVSADVDGNGLAELSVTFSGTELGRLFSSVRGKRALDVTITGHLVSGEPFRAPLQLTVLGKPLKDAQITASVYPNPMNPRGTLRFTMTSPGRVSARIFSVTGRLVRTIARAEPLGTGDQELVIDGRDDDGSPLATGVYFYRVETPDGSSEGRFVVAK